jgi:hypothetical protein
MPIIKYSLERTKELVERIQKKANEGKTIDEACREENVKRGWYYSSLKRIKRKEQSQLQYDEIQHGKKFVLESIGDRDNILKELDRMNVPNRITVPVSLVNYLYMKKLAIDSNIDISNVAAFLLNQKISDDIQSEQAKLKPDVQLTRKTYQDILLAEPK